VEATKREALPASPAFLIEALTADGVAAAIILDLAAGGTAWSIFPIGSKELAFSVCLSGRIFFARTSSHPRLRRGMLRLKMLWMFNPARLHLGPTAPGMAQRMTCWRRR